MDIELKHVHKWFGKVHANDDINLQVNSGCIQGILGENGAGKSTLMKILSGFIQADSGSILLDGKEVKIQNPQDSIKLGIGMLHQDPLDFPPMKVVDNFMLGKEGSLFLNKKAVSNDIRRLAKEFDFQIDPHSYVESLTVGERQQLEILRLIWLGTKILILDEPTTGISANQKDRLFATLNKLAEKGLTILFVSHKLEDIEFLCNKIAVFCQGQLVAERVPLYDTQDLVQCMFGKPVEVGEKTSFRAPAVHLELNDIGVEDYRLKMQAINLSLHAGEVIGLAGMEGSGQSLFLKMVAGLIRPVHGKIILNGLDFTGKPYQAFRNAGISFLPASRLEEGLVQGLTISEHFVLSEPADGLFIDHRRAQSVAEQRIQDFYIKGTPDSSVEQLSGGNQQRTLLALLRDNLNVILLEHPTRGLDIDSAVWIWGKLKERCKGGSSIFFVSADLDEILQYSDRILVFFGGNISEPLDANAVSVSELGQLIGGKGWVNPKEGIL